MFALYSDFYCDAEYGLFKRDLADKTHCVLLRDASDCIQGFTTLKLYETIWEQRPLRVIFSGDTIINPEHWGSQQLAFAWIRFAGKVRRMAPAVPLYWFLICKGHRTYRYLRAFAHRYAPHFDHGTPPFMQELMNRLAGSRFGENYDQARGLLSFAEPQGRLSAELAHVPPAHHRLPDVAYFLKRNPDYARGDELVCLCELAPENLRPLARRVFSQE